MLLLDTEVIEEAVPIKSDEGKRLMNWFLKADNRFSNVISCLSRLGVCACDFCFITQE